MFITIYDDIRSFDIFYGPTPIADNHERMSPRGERNEIHFSLAQKTEMNTYSDVGGWTARNRIRGGLYFCVYGKRSIL